MNAQATRAAASPFLGRDGNRISSGALAAGIERNRRRDRHRREATVRAAAARSCRRVRFVDDPTASTSASRVGTVLEPAYRWERTWVAVVIGDGVSKSAVASLLEASRLRRSAATVMAPPPMRLPG